MHYPRGTRHPLTALFVIKHQIWVFILDSLVIKQFILFIRLTVGGVVCEDATPKISIYILTNIYFDMFNIKKYMFFFYIQVTVGGVECQDAILSGSDIRCTIPEEPATLLTSGNRGISLSFWNISVSHSLDREAIMNYTEPDMEG